MRSRKIFSYRLTPAGDLLLVWDADSIPERDPHAALHFIEELHPRALAVMNDRDRIETERHHEAVYEPSHAWISDHVKRHAPADKFLIFSDIVDIVQ